VALRARHTFLGKGQTDSAEQEFAKVKDLMADKALDQPLFSPNTGRAIPLDRAGSFGG
jgi:hypothetical protein